MTPLILFTYQYKDHTSAKLSTDLGNNRLSYADANGNGKIDTPGSTAITVWEETFEDKSKTNNDWDGSGNTWGWPITDIVSDKAHSGSKSGMLQNTTTTHREIVTHSNEWVNINNSKPTLYKYSGWVFIEPYNHYAEIFFFMKKEGETAYYTQFDRIGTATRGKWVFLEKVVMVPESIKTINIRIDNDGTSDAKVWFDDLKIEKLDMSQNEIVSETNYYPFGLAHKGYNEHVNSTNLGEQFKFNGKELNDEMDLGWYDFGARPYMPDINRTPTIDTHANRYSSLSPYSMFANNPLIYVDPDGKDIVLAAGLTSEQKLQIVGNLQRLTNDKLVYSTQKDGTAIIKIVSLGSQNSNKDLNFGTNLIRVLNKKGADVKTTVIDITTGGNKTLFSGANGKLKSDGTSNVGSDAIVEFNPSKTTGGVDINESKTRPSEIGLGHELIHAKNVNKGEVDLSSSGKTDPDGSGTTLTKEELNSREQENLLREEHNLPSRKIPN